MLILGRLSHILKYLPRAFTVIGAERLKDIIMSASFPPVFPPS
jgi:hypothetical protein